MTRHRNLILGGLGFVGHNLVDKLLLDGEVVKVIDVNIQNQTWHLLDAFKNNGDFSVEIFDCADIARLPCG